MINSQSQNSDRLDAYLENDDTLNLRARMDNLAREEIAMDKDVVEIVRQLNEFTKEGATEKDIVSIVVRNGFATNSEGEADPYNPDATEQGRIIRMRKEGKLAKVRIGVHDYWLLKNTEMPGRASKQVMAELTQGITTAKNRLAWWRTLGKK